MTDANAQPPGDGSGVKLTAALVFGRRRASPRHSRLGRRGLRNAVVVAVDGVLEVAGGVTQIDEGNGPWDQGADDECAANRLRCFRSVVVTDEEERHARYLRCQADHLKHESGDHQTVRVTRAFDGLRILRDHVLYAAIERSLLVHPSILVETVPCDCDPRARNGAVVVGLTPEEQERQENLAASPSRSPAHRHNRNSRRSRVTSGGSLGAEEGGTNGRL
jgi:hypothetical protein